MVFYTNLNGYHKSGLFYLQYVRMGNIYQMDSVWVVKDTAKRVHIVTSWQVDVMKDAIPNGPGISVNVSTQQFILIYKTHSYL